jgi:hypothetical protein
MATFLLFIAGLLAANGATRGSQPVAPAAPFLPHAR